jgi:hypothetical protein
MNGESHGMDKVLASVQSGQGKGDRGKKIRQEEQFQSTRTRRYKRAKLCPIERLRMAAMVNPDKRREW